MNELQVFNNEELGLSVRTILNDDGSISVNAEDAAIGFGWCRREVKNGKEYRSVMWARMNGFLKEIGFAHECAKDDYIPEPLFYRLGMKANNEAADKFQNWLAMKVIPSIRKHGGYIVGQEKMSDDELIAKALIVAHSKIAEKQMQIESLTKEIGIKDQVIGELKPKADYTDRILKNPGLVTITQIAKDYGMSAIEMNKKLHELGIQYKQSNQWMLYSRYHAMGYTHSETVDIVRTDGRSDIKMNTKWTQKGRLFLYNLLKQNGELPLIERGAR